MSTNVTLGPGIKNILDKTGNIDLAMEAGFRKLPTTNTDRYMHALARDACRNYLIKSAKRKDELRMSESKMAKGQGKMETNEFGGKRESNKGRGAFYLIPYEAMEELAIWYEQGAEKYGDRNWEKGMSVKDCINRMMRHAFKASNGWMDEGPFAHLVAVIWNAIAAIVMIKRYPERNDFWPERYKKHFHQKETYIEDYGMAKWPEEKSIPLNYEHSGKILAKNFDKNVDIKDGQLTVTLTFKDKDSYEQAKYMFDL